MRSIWLLFILTLLSSCGKWQSFCCSKCSIQTKDSTWQSVEYICEHDTIPIPYRSVTWDTVLDFSQSVILHRVVKDKGLTGTLDISKGKVSLKVESDSSAIYRDFYIKNITSNRLKVETKLRDCDREHKTKFNYFCTYFFWIVFGLILVWLILKFIKAYFTGK